MVVIDATGVRSQPSAVSPDGRLEPAPCVVFEFVYFARPDSTVVRQDRASGLACGWVRLLAEQAPADADLVMGVPESGLPAAEGYCACFSGLPYGQGLVKNRYIGRTFIAPTQELQRPRGADEAQPASRHHRRQAARGGGRLHSPWHHHAKP